LITSRNEEFLERWLVDLDIENPFKKSEAKEIMAQLHRFIDGEITHNSILNTPRQSYKLYYVICLFLSYTKGIKLR